MRKSAFWSSRHDIEINERQRKVINRLWDGFDGKLNTRKYAKINHCSQDTALRDWIVSEGNADVVGAFRLNNETFGGTAVTSDIIIRKRVNGRKSANAIDVSSLGVIRTVEYDNGEGKKNSVRQLALDVNRHFIEHPEDMAGEMAFAFEPLPVFIRPAISFIGSVMFSNCCSIMANVFFEVNLRV